LALDNSGGAEREGGGDGGWGDVDINALRSFNIAGIRNGERIGRDGVFNGRGYAQRSSTDDGEWGTVFVIGDGARAVGKNRCKRHRSVDGGLSFIRDEGSNGGVGGNHVNQRIFGYFFPCRISDFEGVGGGNRRGDRDGYATADSENGTVDIIGNPSRTVSKGRGERHRRSLIDLIRWGGETLYDGGS